MFDQVVNAKIFLVIWKYILKGHTWT